MNATILTGYITSLENRLRTLQNSLQDLDYQIANYQPRVPAADYADNGQSAAIIRAQMAGAQAELNLLRPLANMLTTPEGLEALRGIAALRS